MKCINQASSENWKVFNGDSFEMIWGLPENSVHFTVSSVPFSQLYCYSNSIRDAGNCRDDREFFDQFEYLVKGLKRAIKPGRLVSVHCMDLPTSKERDGYIGIRDFRGDLIRAFIGNDASEFYGAIRKLQIRFVEAMQNDDTARAERIQNTIQSMEDELTKYPGESGFIFHSSVTIWKDPVTAMQRTKALGLLHKQVMKDSTMSRQGIPDYLVTFRHPEQNEEPVAGLFDRFVGENPPRLQGDSVRDSINIWQRYASPVWDDINMSDTYQFQSAKANGDLKHICCLQKQVIQRALQLWTNPGDVVLDPFSGIGSTGLVAMDMGRKYIGFELKESYYNASVKNLSQATEIEQLGLFTA